MALGWRVRIGDMLREGDVGDRRGLGLPREDQAWVSGRSWRAALLCVASFVTLGGPVDMRKAAAQETAARDTAGQPSTLQELMGDALEDFARGRFAEAMASWRAAADMGESRAALYIGALYDSGEGVPQDQRVAMAWYARAARGGSPAGAFNLAVLYDAGRVVPRDEGAAARWYSVAASRGFARAQYNLALMYQDGAGVPREPARAIFLFRAAARQGLGAARARLEQMGRPYAGMSHPGTDVAMQEFQMAQQALLNRRPADTARAATLFRRAAAANNAMAQYDLGYCYENGIGLVADKVQADGWYHRAAQSATQPALRSLATAAAAQLERGFTPSQLEAARGMPNPR